MVGGVDARRVVDGVSIDAAAAQGIFNATLLGEAEIAAFAHHLGAQLAAIDAQRIVGAVAHIIVAFGFGFHIGADTAIPQQIDRGFEDEADHLIRRRSGEVGAEHGAHFLGERDGLRLALEHAATLGDQLRLVIGPGRARFVEQALALFEAQLRVGAGVEEDVHVVEGRH